MDARLQLIDTIWEGVFAADFTLEQVRRRCIHLGKALSERGWSCLVAYDTRFMSDIFARYICHMFTTEGIPVQLAAMPAPLPAIHTALVQNKMDCALVVSARNKPYWYNGLALLKVRNTDTILFSDEEHRDDKTLLLPFPPTVETGNPQPEITSATLDVRRPYLDTLRSRVDVNLIRRATMTIFVDTMHGTTAGYIPAIIGDEAQTMAIEINRETDPLFNRLTPLPSESRLTRLCKLVRESDSHLGLALSADGTALGVVDKNGEQLDYLEVVLLLASYMMRHYRLKGQVIAPPSLFNTTTTRNGLLAWEEAVGLKLDVTTQATQRIADVLTNKQPDLLIGCTPDGKLILGNDTRYPDALLAGLLLIELVARSGGSLRSLLEELRARLSLS